MPRIYSRRRTAQAKDPIPPGAVYVGRPSSWGNPFPVAQEKDREWSCERFREYALKRLEREPGWLEPLRGKSLVCWCQSPSDPRPKRCHAETILELLGD